MWWARTYLLAARRKWSLLLSGHFDPYPKPPDGVELSPSISHFADCETAPLRLSWDRGNVPDPLEWQARVRAKLGQLLGIKSRASEPEARHWEDSISPNGLRRRKVYLRAAEHVDIPLSILSMDVEKTRRRPPLLYMAGSTSGVHVGWGEARIPADYLLLGVGADMAAQAAKRGFVVVCIEQSCFGERLERHLMPRSENRTVDAAHHALLLGRTLLGEQVMDVSSVIDWLAAGKSGFEIDLSRLHVFGHSSGGSIALYAAAMDTRIRTVICSGCVGFIRETIARRRHPSLTVTVPGILQWMESDDIVGLCAPRPFLAVSGKSDHIFPFQGVEAVIESARRIYSRMNAEGSILAVSGNAGHQYYPDVTWDALSRMVPAEPVTGKREGMQQ